jgi:hypothetical protein
LKASVNDVLLRESRFAMLEIAILEIAILGIAILGIAPDAASESRFER